MKYIIATRKSKLARAQTETVMGLLKNKGIQSEKLLLMTEGDRRLDVSLNKIGGKGLFIKEIEYALLDGRAHLAVHSMKDVPYELDKAFKLIAMPERDDIRDVFVSSNEVHFDELKSGAKIGTSSIRRAAMLKEIRSDLEIVPIRGNVNTRLEKMHKENMDGIILAAAGLKRLDMEDIITDYFDPEIFLPAVGQGALGIECLSDFKDKEIIKELDSIEVRRRVIAERSFMKELNGDCHSLIGIFSKEEGSDLYLKGTYSIAGEIITKDIIGDKLNGEELGRELAKKIIASGR
ncbi:hydroxymethylbilane synthase [Clostridium sp. LY3-2]|uniref:hydroxymethylbilane synthase n=1 Tax=Clostridium sp. LY3-2 TaxID=2942482 RepID=UPI00215335BE|nr:hydroxymethylbilane synthase [Clostridium sp. LY3-2]MCR6513654.1 hydroxymethylbilane synthase [Clostridium sp. LY3-2]